MGYEEQKIEGRNAVLEAFRSGKTIDKLFVLDGCQDGPVRTIVREARKHDTIINFVDKERLDQLSETKKHQGVIAVAAAYEYAEVEDILKNAEEKGQPPFIFILDNIEDPHNLGAIIRTANLAGAHGVIIDPSNTIIGEYMCQGKMPQSVRERYVKMKENPEHPANLDALIKNFDCALSHPDSDDLEKLRNLCRLR